MNCYSLLGLLHYARPAHALSLPSVLESLLLHFPCLSRSLNLVATLALSLSLSLALSLHKRMSRAVSNKSILLMCKRGSLVELDVKERAADCLHVDVQGSDVATVVTLHLLDTIIEEIQCPHPFPLNRAVRHSHMHNSGSLSFTLWNLPIRASAHFFTHPFLF